MGRPKFTVDVPPVNASREELLAWQQEQLRRIQDRWPKDLEDRLEALEELVTSKTGSWPIVTASSVSFTPLVESEADPCTNASMCYLRSAPAFQTQTGADARQPSISYDGEYLLLPKNAGGSIPTYYRSGGAWVAGDTLDASDWAGDGYDIDNFGQGGGAIYSDGCLIGDPFSDEDGTNVGLVFVYTGNPVTGFSKNGVISAPSPSAGSILRSNFGSNIVISGDELVMAIAAYGNQNNAVMQRIHFYDRNPLTNVWSVRTGAIEQGQGGDIYEYENALSYDGSMIVLGQQSFGTGRVGRVDIYDYTSGTDTWARRHVINIPDSPKPAEWPTSPPNYDYEVSGGDDAHRFGHGVFISRDNSTFWTSASIVETFSNLRRNFLFVYELNLGNNRYELCDIIHDPTIRQISGTNAIHSNVGGVTGLWNDSYKIAIFPVSSPTSQAAFLEYDITPGCT